MELRLDGKTALVTGGSRGIGRAIAQAFVDAGASVMLSSRRAEGLTESAAAIEAARIDQTGGVAWSVANAGDPEQAAACVAATVERFGQVDILVNNAATNPYYGPMAGIADEQFRKILENNIVANNWLVTMVSPQMMARRAGSIIIVSSIGGLRGSSVLGAYCISKAADMQLARNLAVELGPHNVRVNCIAPGLIKTDFAKALWDNPETLALRNAETPLRRIGDPDEIAGAAVYLAAPASSFMTGQSLVIDGGVTI